MSLNDLKLATRLRLGFGAVLVLSMVIAVINHVSLTRLTEAVADMNDDKLPQLVKATDWQLSLLQSARQMRNVFVLEGKALTDKELAALPQRRADRKTAMDALSKVVDDAQGIEALKTATAAAADYDAAEDVFIRLASADDMVAAKKQLLDEARPKQLAYLATLEKFAQSQTDVAHASGDIAIAQGKLATKISLALTLAALGLGAGIAWWITRSTVRPLTAATAVARQVAGGDLSGAIPAESPHTETGQLLQALRDMQTKLSSVVGTVRGNAEGVAGASGQIASGNADLSSRTEQQASALQQTAASMEELSATVKQNADSASQANQLALNAQAVAVQGGDVVGQVITTMQSINDSSRKIADIIGTIDGIAFQTNILALNAAVEAARAGEQGRGFAVVASEVRSLAQRSAEAAREIKGLIGASVERVEQGSALVDRAGATMTEVVGAIRRVTDIVGEISAASSEQSRGVAQVGEAITQMDRATQQNAALVEESAAAADSLKQQAQQLVGAVAVFQLAGSSGAATAAAPPLQATAGKRKAAAPTAHTAHPARAAAPVSASVSAPVSSPVSAHSVAKASIQRASDGARQAGAGSSTRPAPVMTASQAAAPATPASVTTAAATAAATATSDSDWETF